MYRQSEKLVKQQHILQMSPQYDELRPTNGWDWFTSLRHPSKFQRISRLAFDVAQRNFAYVWLSPGLVNYIIHFRELLPLTEFCQVHNSLYIQVLRSPILPALLHGTPTAGISQTLRRGTRNGITELSQRAPPIFGWVAITLGIGKHSSFT